MARVAEQGAGLHKTSLVELGIALLQFLVTHLINAGADKDVPRFVKEPEARKKYVEAFRRSSIEGMLNYYKANYPKESDKDDREFPPVKCPVLIIHGLQDPYLLPGALNDTWKWVENDLTLVTIPKAGHFVHRDASARVTRTMVQWLTAETNTTPKVEIGPTEK